MGELKTACHNCRHFLRRPKCKARIKGLDYDPSNCDGGFEPIFDDDEETQKVDRLK